MIVSYNNVASDYDLIVLPTVLEGLEENYPGFHSWLNDKAIPSIRDGSGKIVVARIKDEIVGVALGKATATENKIRCVRVKEPYRNHGIGYHLIERMMKEIDCDKPLITVPQTLIHDYSRTLVNHFKYDLTYVEKGLYVENKLEYVFNGDIKET